MKKLPKSAFAGACAGAVTGLLGTGGGMVLVLSQKRREPFAGSVAVMVPICLLSLMSAGRPMPWREALPFLAGGSLGGIGAGIWGRKIPTVWLHRLFGGFLLMGGLRALW